MKPVEAYDLSEEDAETCTRVAEDRTLMSRAVAQSIGRIILIAFVLVALLAVVSTARFATIREGRHVSSSQNAARTMKPVKGDVRRTKDGALEYFDGRQWTRTPPPPTDDAF